MIGFAKDYVRIGLPVWSTRRSTQGGIRLRRLFESNRSLVRNGFRGSLVLQSLEGVMAFSVTSE